MKETKKVLVPLWAIDILLQLLCIIAVIAITLSIYDVCTMEGEDLKYAICSLVLESLAIPTIIISKIGHYKTTQKKKENKDLTK